MYRIEINPDEPFCDLLATLELGAELLQGKGCKGQEMRAKVILTIDNHCPYVKQRFEIAYTRDTDSLAICDGLDPSPSCEGGRPSFTISFPATIRYWRAPRKTFVKAICWCWSEEDPDFNLHVDVSSTAFSPSRDPDELQDLAVSAVFTVYGRKEETQ